MSFTAPQTTALQNLLAEWESQGQPLIQDMAFKSATELNASAPSLAVLVRKGYVADKADSVSLWGERTKAVYRLTLRGRNVAREIAA